ncbi:hypothetical protein JKF63_02321 [Porcisia hertigi]|uniref:Uncharacterized protein n=1 Tax=Porcisia hertigi TaxID=2761500 RepID=A0A836IDI5_9TRYP|nr:hypothetical protein JKF63_02321 [Porcisia hertigi]
MFSTPALPNPYQPLGNATGALSATRSLGGMPASGAANVSANGDGPASATPVGAAANPVVGHGAHREINEVKRPIGDSTPSSTRAFQQVQKHDAMVIGGGGGGGGGNGNFMHGPNSAGGFRGMYGVGGIGAAQRDGFTYGTVGLGLDGMEGYGSMAGGGSIYGGIGSNRAGSIYGMSAPMGSMYGMGASMGSMYGMGGPVSSMYVMGVPMGSLYGMGAPMGSMYGMGGPMSSMYGVGGMGGPSYMARSMSFSSYGGNSMYGSMGGSSLIDVGGPTRGISGMWGTNSSVYVRRRPDSNIPTVARVLRDDEDKTPQTATVNATRQPAEKGKTPPKGLRATADPLNRAKTAEPDQEEIAADGKSRFGGDQHQGTYRQAKPEGKSRASNGGEAALNGTASTSAAKDEVSAADRNNIHGLIILENIKSTTLTTETAKTGQTVSLKTASGKSTECRVDEVIKGSDLDMSKSAVLDIVSTHLRSGYNSALIVIDMGEGMSAAVGEVIVAFYADSLGKLAAGQEWEVIFSASAMSGTSKYRDLQEDTAQEAPPKSIVFGSNPLFGSCIMDLKTATMKDVKEVAHHVRGLLAKKTQLQEIVFLHAVVRIRKDEELLLCSMNVYIVRDSETAEATAALDDHRVPVPVLRNAIGGATKTAAVVVLSGAAEAAAAEAEAVRIMGSLCSKENLPPRSGNVLRFVEYTNEQIARITEEMGNLGSAERERSASMVEKMRKMSNDAAELMSNTDALPKVYPIHHKSRPHCTAAASKGIRVKEDPAATEGDKTRDSAANGKPTPLGVAVAAPVTPFSSIHRLAFFQDTKDPSISKAVHVVVGGSMKAYDVDECIESPATDKMHTVEQSNELSRMASLLAAGFNVALLGAEFTAPTQPDAQMTWKCVRHLLISVLQSAAPETTTEATLYMSVVHGRQVLADLGSGDTEPKRLAVFTSPLFGPVVHGTTGVKVTTPEEVDVVMSKALTNSQPVLKDGAMIVVTAVVQRIRQDDVVVASIFAVSAADMRPYKGILEQNPSYSRTLFTYSLGGPSSTGVLITAPRHMDSAELANAFTVQRSLAHVKVPMARSGSVKEFVQYLRVSVERQKKKLAAATEPADKEAMMSCLHRLSESLRDHEELLANPKTVSAKAYSPELVVGGVVSSATKELIGQVSTSLQDTQALAATPQKEESQKNVSHVTPAVVPVSKPQDTTPREPQPLQVQETEDPKPNKDPKPQDENPCAEKKLLVLRTEEPPKEKLPAAAEPPKVVQSESTHAVRLLAIITESAHTSLQAKEGWSVESDSEGLIVTDVEGAHRFAVNEVVHRKNRGSPIDSKLLEELSHRFLQGDNVALLTADARGSAASLEMVDNTVRRILRKMPPSHSLFMSLCALKVKENVVLDTLTEGSEFKTVEVSTSPLLGPLVTGANFVKVGVVEQFSNLMSSSLRTCGESRACVVLQLVQVEMRAEHPDANVSSLLAIMCPGDTSMYSHALDQPVKESGLLSLVLSGACYTVFAVGLTRHPVDEGCLILSRLVTAFQGLVPNLKLRSGSVKRFIDHTRDAVAHMQKKYERSASPEERSKMQKYIDALTHMVEKSEAYLADPVGKIPPSFPHTRERGEL